MKPTLSRREFLKLAGLLSASYAIPPSIRRLDTPNQDNILVIVFDAWSAANTSLYGYERKTTPNIDRLAQKAIVYHNHFAGAHYTTPGVASLLTGTTPWTHQAFDYNDTVVEDLISKNIFYQFPSYQRLAYSHNPLVNTLLRQFVSDIDGFTSWENLYLENDPLINKIFQNDYDIASIGWNRALKQQDDGFSYNLFISQIFENYKQKRVKKLSPSFPRGVPNYDGTEFYTLEPSIDWLTALLGEAPQPFLGYFHFLPPHYPYNTRVEFVDKFAKDGFRSPIKPYHFLKDSWGGGWTDETIYRQRRLYDEFILYADAEFARLFADLENRGILENTWLILTSDHGEIFERGLLRHYHPVYYRPSINVPLLIFPPRQNQRIDVTEPTSVIDLLPTLMKISGQIPPNWAEGEIMPPFSAAEVQRREPIMTIQVVEKNKNGTITKASLMVMKGGYKLLWHLGYEQLGESGENIELYDIFADPEEINNLYPQAKNIAVDMIEILRMKLAKLGL